jgi:hypothetical protein
MRKLQHATRSEHLRGFMESMFPNAKPIDGLTNPTEDLSDDAQSERMLELNAA